MARRRKRHKIGKMRFIWRVLIVIHLILLTTQLYSKAYESLSEQPAVKRWTTLTLIDGVKYRVNKYWNISL